MLILYIALGALILGGGIVFMSGLTSTKSRRY